MKTTDSRYVEFNRKFIQHTMMEYVMAALNHLSEQGSADFTRIKSHFEDPDEIGSLPPQRRFVQLLDLLENRRGQYDVGNMPDFWLPCYPGYEALIRVRDYVRMFKDEP